MTPAPVTPAPLPEIACVVCGQPLKSIWQPGLLPSQDGMFLVTCENPNCRMHGFTLTDKNYPPDLALYLVPKVEFAS